MPAVKLVTIRDDDNNPVESHFEPSKTFAESAMRNRLPMLRPDGRPVNVNKKLQARGHYDDKHGFTLPPVKVESKEKVK